MMKTLIALVVIIPLLGFEVSAKSLLRQLQEGSCKEDYWKHCSKVMPGQGRVLKCLRSRAPELEENCMNFPHLWKTKEQKQQAQLQRDVYQREREMRKASQQPAHRDILGNYLFNKQRKDAARDAKFKKWQKEHELRWQQELAKWGLGKNNK